MRSFLIHISCLSVALAATVPASATSYSVDQAIGGFGSVTGTIDTDGTTGALGTGNFVAWNLLVTGNGASTTLTNLNSGVYITGSGLTASATAISFDFSNPIASYLLFQAGGFGNGNTYWCNASALGACVQGASAAPQSYYSASFQSEARAGVQVLASNAAVPEPATWAMFVGGFGLIGAGVRRQRASVRFA